MKVNIDMPIFSRSINSPNKEILYPPLTKDGFSTICNPKVMSRYLSAPDANILTSLSQEQAAKTNMVSVIRIQVFSIMEGVGNTYI